MTIRFVCGSCKWIECVATVIVDLHVYTCSQEIESP